MNEKTDYRPVACSFHDHLEAIATTGKIATTRFRGAGEQIGVATSRIIDIVSREGAEFLILQTGEHIRLDMIVGITVGSEYIVPGP